MASCNYGPQSATSLVSGYHAHIYYDGAVTRDRAAILRQWIAERFLVRIGAWHDSPVGSHPLPMFQVAFAKEMMSVFVPWLMLNRLGLGSSISWRSQELALPITDCPAKLHIWRPAALPTPDLADHVVRFG